MAVYRKQTELDGAVRHELMGYIVNDGEMSGNRHSHPFAEILYVPEGELNLEYEDTVLRLIRGQGVVIRPYTEHRISGDKKAILLYIGCNYIRSGTFSVFPKEKVLKIDDTAVLNELQNIIEQYMLCNDSTEEASVLLTPLDLFLRRLAEHSATDQNTDILIERVKEYLDLHIHEQISVTDLAEKFYISSHYLGNRFQKHVGMTIKQYHSKLRMERALSLIESSSLSLSQISEQLGFNTQQYFSNCFKAYFGVSPREIHRNKL